jgi:2'-5' RNA ligase
MSRQTPSLRLFYALWPDALTRARLATWQQHIAGRKVPVQNLHLTLAFLGSQPRSLLPVLETVLQECALPSLQLELDHFGFFSGQRIAWAGASQAPSALFTLQQALWQTLLDARIPLKPVAGFRPHITLARNALPPPQIVPQPVSWRIEKMALLESVSTDAGVLYVPLAEKTAA